MNSIVAQHQDDEHDEQQPKKMRELTKDDVVGRIDAYQQKQRAKPKATAADMESKFDARRAQRKQQRAQRAEQNPHRVGSYVRIGIGVALLVATGAMTLMTSNSEETFAQQSVANEQELGSVQGDLNELEPEMSMEERQEALDAQLSTAREQAEEVADLQQQFAEILYAGNNEETPGDGAPGESFIESAEHRKQLAPYFHENSWVVDGDLAYAPGSLDPFERDQMDPRFPWYIRYADEDRLEYADPETYQWEVVSVVPTSLDDAGVSDVTWMVTDEQGDLLAWATASYSDSDETFYGLRVGQTTIGDRFGAYSEEQED